LQLKEQGTESRSRGLSQIEIISFFFNYVYKKIPISCVTVFEEKKGRDIYIGMKSHYFKILATLVHLCIGTFVLL
jgi:hypothetical protein